MAKITWTFKNEEGTNLNRYIATNVSTGEKITFDLLRGGNISVVGTPLNAENLNALITSINACYDLISSSEKDTTYTLSKNGNAIRLTSSSGVINDVTLNKSDVGLSNVDNTSDLDKPVSTAQQNALNNRVPITRKINGYSLNEDRNLNKNDIGLSNVDNTSDMDKPISNATQQALDLKANKSDVYTKSETYTKTETDTRIAEKLDEKQTTEVNCSHEVEITGFGEEDCNLAIDDQDVVITKIQGQTRRKSLNLWDYKTCLKNTILKGTITEVSNGFTLTATANDCHTITYNNVGAFKSYVKPNTTYTLSFTSNNNLSGNVIIFEYSSITPTNYNKMTTINNSRSKSITFTTSSDTIIIQLRFGVANSGESITYTNIMLNEGSTALPYEPYDNTLVNSKCDFKSIGRNLFSGGVSLTSMGFIEGQRYTISTKDKKTYNFKIATESDATSGSSNYLVSKDNTTSMSFTWNNNQNWNLYIWNTDWTMQDNNNLYVMLNYGNTALPYEPYVEDKMQCGLELGAFDYHDNVSHITHRQTSKKWTWNASQSIRAGGAYTYGYRLDVLMFDDTNMGETKGISNWKYDFNMIANPNVNNNNSICVFNSHLYVFVNGATNEQEARNVLDNNPPSLVYKLTTETTEENILPSGYKVWYKGLQIQKTETLPYILTKQYGISLASQVLNNVSIDRSQQKQLDELKENKLNKSDLKNWNFDNGDLKVNNNTIISLSADGTHLNTYNYDLYLEGASQRPFYYDGNSEEEIALLEDVNKKANKSDVYTKTETENKLKSIEDRLDAMGFKVGVASINGATATTNTLKKQGKYCIFNLVLESYAIQAKETKTITITIPVGFRPKEETKINFTYFDNIPSMTTLEKFLEITVGTNGIIVISITAGNYGNNIMFPKILNAGWEIA